MLATGSYGQTTAIYREDNMELLYILHGQQGGVRDMCNSQKMVTIYIRGGKRTLTYSAGTYAKLLTLCLSCIDLQKIPISGYCLILILLVSILVQAVRTDWFKFIISNMGQWILSIASHSIHFCQWQALHQGRFVSFDDSLEDFSLSGDENCASIWSFAYASMADNATCMDSGDSNLCQDPCIVLQVICIIAFTIL
ncbi:hypothetical protein HYC85_004037 [Camellia sinensis]|uniref:Uncharacterized protein n=1 Tax=Camellia sinensis TaxID=4442 RepID=A0A7J7HVC5_CAMSI|nr:hypothetical protein HYC85_004037 [Camellia sinensis]